MTTSNKGSNPTSKTTTKAQPGAQQAHDDAGEETGGQADLRVLLIIAGLLVLPALLKFLS